MEIREVMTVKGITAKVMTVRGITNKATTAKATLRTKLSRSYISCLQTISSGWMGNVASFARVSGGEVYGWRTDANASALEVKSHQYSMAFAWTMWYLRKKVIVLKSW